jgi:NAD(P)-dependent dehydrogenase (short-subunit alcohol dehydrogenase family)
MSTPQTILITGSTAGIGRYVALQLAQAGHRVLASGRNEKALAALVQEGAGRIHGVPLDVTDAASIAAAATAVERLTEGRGLDVLINNAGYGQPGALADLADADLRRQFETNVFGLMAVTKALLPALRRSGRGKILNVSSIGGRITMPLFGAYHASKYAVEALSDALRIELRPLGIAVALIEPGPIHSQFADRALAGLGTLGGQLSPYAAAYAQAERVQATANAQASGPQVVLRAMQHAIAAKRPRARYVVPRRLGLMLLLSRLLPTRVLDWFMTRLMGLSALRSAKSATPS